MTAPTPDQIDLLRQRLAADRHLGVLITGSPNSTDPQVAVVNAAIITHPETRLLVLALVARTGAKLGNLRRQPRATLVVRDGWEWIAARGPVELSGPDDPNAFFNANNQRQLSRDIFHAAGGRHNDLDEYDRVMLAERRCAVLISLERIWSNPPGSEHLEPTNPTNPTNQEPS